MTVMSVVLLPFLALAAPAQPEADRSAEQVERQERRERLRRVMGLAEALDLDTQQALRLDETLRKFDERRRPLLEQVRESALTLMRAADGDTSAQGQVDQASARAFDARAQLASLDREMFQALSKDLPPQKKARLALFLARTNGMGRLKLKGLDKARNVEERMERKMKRMRERMDWDERN
jgi:hypothetical protein